MKKSICLLTALMSLSLTAQNWLQHEDMPSVPVMNSANFVIDGYAYAIGGNNGTQTSDCWRYDPETDVWSTISSLPKVLSGSVGFSLEGKGYIVGGYSGSPLYHSDDVYEYDPVFDFWTQKSDFPGAARYAMFSFTLGNEVFIGCGNSGTGSGPFHNDVYKYFQDTDSWQQLEDFPSTIRYACRGFSFEGKGYVIGGKTPAGFSSELWAFDPVTNSWEQKEPFPMNGAYQSILPLEETVLVISAQNEANVVYEYYADLDTWFSRPDYPGGSGRSASYFQVNGRSFIASGRDDSQANHNDVWEYVGKIPSSVNDISEIQLGIHPNPMTDFLTLNTGAIRGQLQIEIIDMYGRLISSEVNYSENGKLIIPRSDLATGIYVLRVSAQGESYELRMGVE